MYITKFCDSLGESSHTAILKRILTMKMWRRRVVQRPIVPVALYPPIMTHGYFVLIETGQKLTYYRINVDVIFNEKSYAEFEAVRALSQRFVIIGSMETRQ